MSTTAFRFKQFSVAQDRCAMKVGTDGVLLGAWSPLDHQPYSVLDIGTGTGVIALMLAQRSMAQQIDAVELDENAYEQATSNFENSPWSDRLFCYHAHLYEFAVEVDESYDLIVCNPPFFAPHYKTDDSARDKARFEDALPFDLLVGAVAKLLSDHGRFTMILPFERETDFCLLAKKADLYPSQILRVRGTAQSSIKRSLLCLKKRNVDTAEHPKLKSVRAAGEEPVIKELTIEIARHQYTDEYRKLVEEFYLKM